MLLAKKERALLESEGFDFSSAKSEADAIPFKYRPPPADAKQITYDELIDMLLKPGPNMSSPEERKLQKEKEKIEWNSKRKKVNINALFVARKGVGAPASL